MGLTRGERNDLLSVARKRERVARSQIEARSAELLADFERQMASVYAFDDDATWRQAMEDASRALAEADEQVKARCRELGIPTEYRPGMRVEWMGRGQNAVLRRQEELRRVAKSRIRQVAEAAKHRIEAASVEVQEKIIVEGLSDGARVALREMPTPEQLMPTLDVLELEEMVARPVLLPGL